MIKRSRAILTYDGNKIVTVDTEREYQPGESFSLEFEIAKKNLIKFSVKLEPINEEDNT